MGDAGLALDGVMGPLEWSDIWATIYSKHATLLPRSYTPTPGPSHLNLFANKQTNNPFTQFVAAYQ